MLKIYLTFLLAIGTFSGLSFAMEGEELLSKDEKEEIIIALSSDCLYCKEPIKSKGCCSNKPIFLLCGHSYHQAVS